MFSFFKKKENSPKHVDIVFVKQSGKYNALAEAAKKNPQQVFVAWFESSLLALQAFFQQNHINAEVIHYRQIRSNLIGTNPVIFIEHHPLADKEKQVFQSLEASKIFVYSSLDEPLLLHFGGDRINALLQNIGVQENEPISHSLITRSITNVQQKIATKVTVEQSAVSMDEWMQKNVGEQ